MPDRFLTGQSVEFYPTIPSHREVSIAGGTRGIVQAVERTRPNEDGYLVAFLENERLTGEMPRLRHADLFAA
jgi:hypothetical protein